MTPPTALTLEEQATFESWAWQRHMSVEPLLAIIRRLDARVGELEEEVANAHEALAVAVAAANEYGYEQCRTLITQRDALQHTLDARECVEIGCAAFTRAAEMWQAFLAEARGQRDALARAAELMLAEAKNDVTGEYSSPAICALRAALTQVRGSGKESA